MCPRSHVGDERRAEAGDALAAFVADAAVEDAVGAGRAQLPAERLRGLVARGIVQRCKPWFVAAHIVELGVEIGDVLTHLDAGLEHADLLQLPRAVVDRLRQRGRQRETGIPGAALAIGEAGAAGLRMAEGGHDHRRVRPARHPLRRRNRVDHAELGRDPVVGPAHELDDRRQIGGRGDGVEDAGGGIAARDQAVGVGAPQPGQRRRQLHPARRASSRRRTRCSPSMPPSTMSESAGRPPKSGLELGSFTQLSASPFSG